MQALFVHGMGRSPASGWPLLWQLKRAGLKTASFGYSVSVEDFPGIRRRLVSKICALAEGDDYVLIGHSLGGLLLRSALNALPPQTREPRHVFLLGSPVRPARLAQKLGGNSIYRALTGDCGQLLGSAQRMSEIGPVSAPSTGIAGVRGLPLKRGPFGGELNDGVVALSEVSAEWLTEQLQTPTVHTLLPSSKKVARLVLERIARDI